MKKDRNKYVMILICTFTSLYLMFSACDPNRRINDPSPYLPANVKIVINHDAVATNDTTLRVNLLADNTILMQIGMDSSLSDAEWEEFDTLRIFNVERNEGTVYVFGRFAAVAGTTGILSDDIILDFTARIDRLTLDAASDTLFPGDSIIIKMETGEDGDAHVSLTGVSLKFPLFADSAGYLRGILKVPAGINEPRVITHGYFADWLGNEAIPIRADREFSFISNDFNLELISTFPMADVLGNDIWYKSGVCFVGDTNSVHLINVRELNSPVWMRSIYTGSWSKRYAGYGSELYIPHYYGLTVLRIEPPEEAHIIGRAALNEITRGVVIDHSYAYVSGLASGLLILDVSDPEEPIFMKRLLLNSGGDLICKEDKFIYILSGSSGFVINVEHLENPDLIASFEVSGNPFEMVVNEGYLFVATEIDGIIVVDVNNPYDPIVINKHREFSPAYSLEVISPFLYIGGYDEIRVINTTDPLNLEVVAQLNELGEIHGIFVSESYLFMSGPEMLTTVSLFSDEN